MLKCYGYMVAVCCFDRSLTARAFVLNSFESCSNPLVIAEHSIMIGSFSADRPTVCRHLNALHSLIMNQAILRWVCDVREGKDTARLNVWRAYLSAVGNVR